MKDKKKGVDASNRDYIAYEGVDKRHAYRFAEAEAGYGEPTVRAPRVCLMVTGAPQS